MPRKPVGLRGVCQVCGHRGSLRADGSMRKHPARNAWQEIITDECLGVTAPPRERQPIEPRCRVCGQTPLTPPPGGIMPPHPAANQYGVLITAACWGAGL